MKSSRYLTYLSAGVLLGLAVLTGLSLAPRAGWAPELIRIGVVNWEQTISQYKDYQNELKELQSKRKRILNLIEKEYENVPQDQLKQSEGTASGGAEMQKLYQNTLEQHKQRRKRVIEEYHKKIMSAIRDEAIEQGYSLILSENEVLYAAEGYTDLTNGVIERLNQNSQNSSS
jgi:Skp family chaperone for outer membrane proteins